MVTRTDVECEPVALARHGYVLPGSEPAVEQHRRQPVAHLPLDRPAQRPGTARASSVLPTPVGPKNRKLPMGRFGSPSAIASPWRFRPKCTHLTIKIELVFAFYVVIAT